MRVRCNACGGEYDPAPPGGIRYFHACPPLTFVRVLRLGVEHRIPLADVQPTDTITVERAGAPLQTLADRMQPGDVRDGDIQIARDNARDENQFETFQDEYGRAFTRPLQDGPGATPID